MVNRVSCLKTQFSLFIVLVILVCRASKGVPAGPSAMCTQTCFLAFNSTLNTDSSICLAIVQIEFGGVCILITNGNPPIKHRSGLL